MRGVKSDDILAIVDFIYRGEADVFQKNLDSFLAVGGELQLIGLMGKNGCKGGRLCLKGMNKFFLNQMCLSPPVPKLLSRHRSKQQNTI